MFCSVPCGRLPVIDLVRLQLQDYLESLKYDIEREREWEKDCVWEWLLLDLRRQYPPRE